MSAIAPHQGNTPAPTPMVTSPNARTPTLPSNAPSTPAARCPCTHQNTSAKPKKAATAVSIAAVPPPWSLRGV